MVSYIWQLMVRQDIWQIYMEYPKKYIHTLLRTIQYEDYVTTACMDNEKNANTEL